MNRIDRGAIVIGLLFVGAGILFLLEALDVFAISPGVLWPILIIGFGVGVALGGRPQQAADEPAQPDGPLID